MAAMTTEDMIEQGIDMPHDVDEELHTINEKMNALLSWDDNVPELIAFTEHLLPRLLAIFNDLMDETNLFLREACTPEDRRRHVATMTMCSTILRQLVHSYIDAYMKKHGQHSTVDDGENHIAEERAKIYKLLHQLRNSTDGTKDLTPEELQAKKSMCLRILFLCRHTYADLIDALKTTVNQRKPISRNRTSPIDIHGMPYYIDLLTETLMMYIIPQELKLYRDA
jgi:hypothetical protein